MWSETIPYHGNVARKQEISGDKGAVHRGLDSEYIIRRTCGHVQQSKALLDICFDYTRRTCGHVQQSKALLEICFNYIYCNHI